MASIYSGKGAGGFKGFTEQIIGTHPAFASLREKSGLTTSKVSKETLG